MTPTVPTGTKSVTQLRIERALAKPGAHGARGFLLWVEAAWPRKIAQKIVTAAGRASGFAGFGRFGAFADATYDPSNPDAVFPTTTTDDTNPPVSTVTAATSSSAASPDWASSIQTAITDATQIYLTKVQADAAQKLFDVNLQRAQMGLRPIATDPTKYGLPAPTANIGLASSTQSTLLVVGGIVAAGFILHGLAQGKRR